MKMEVIRIVQFGGGEGSHFELYVGGAKFREIKDKLDVDRWSRDNRLGYQRITLIKKRIYQGGKSSLRNYLLEQLGLFPTSILVAIREKVNFKPFNEGNAGILEIPDDAKLYVIDGMHRVETLRITARENEEFDEYYLNLTLIPLNERFWELLLFHIVHSRAKRIPTDLAYRHMQTLLEQVNVPRWVKTNMMTSKEFRTGKAAEIIDILAEEEGSPFAGVIRYYGEEREPHHLVDDSTLIRYTSNLLKEPMFRDINADFLADILKDYWTAIKETWSEAFDDPNNYNLLGTHFGIATLTYLFPTIWTYCVREGKVDKENMKRYLNLLTLDLRVKIIRTNKVSIPLPIPPDLDTDFKRPINSEWWSKVHGAGIIHASSEGMFRKASQEMAKKIAIIKRYVGDLH